MASKKVDPQCYREIIKVRMNVIRKRLLGLSLLRTLQLGHIQNRSEQRIDGKPETARTKSRPKLTLVLEYGPGKGLIL